MRACSFLPRPCMHICQCHYRHSACERARPFSLHTELQAYASGVSGSETTASETLASPLPGQPPPHNGPSRHPPKPQLAPHHGPHGPAGAGKGFLQRLTHHSHAVCSLVRARHPKPRPLIDHSIVLPGLMRYFGSGLPARTCAMGMRMCLERLLFCL